MSSKETPLNMPLARPSLTSSTSSNTTTTTSTPALTPSTTPATLALEKEQEPLTAPPPPTIAVTSPGGATITRTNTKTNTKHPLSALERDYDPTRDDLPIDALLARPRLPRSPAESFHRPAMNGRTMKPLKAAGEDARRAEDFEAAKARLRAAGVEMGQRVFPTKE